MRLGLSVLIIFTLGLYLTPKAHAIIFLPALILIPIAKILAIVIAGFAFPALGLGAIWSNLFEKSYKRTFLVIGVLFILLITILAIFIKLQNPERPWF